MDFPFADVAVALNGWRRSRRWFRLDGRSAFAVRIRQDELL